MKTNRLVLLTSLFAALVAAPAIARGPGGGNGAGPQGDAGVCPLGFERGSGMCGGMGPGAGVCDGTQKHLRLRDGSCLATAPARTDAAAPAGNADANATRPRDGSGKATAPGRGPKDGTGNNASCPNVAPQS